MELMLEDFDRLGGKGMNNPTLAKTFAENCGRAVDWLDTVVGVDFGERVPTYGGYVALNVPRVHYAVPADGDVSKSSGKGRLRLCEGSSVQRSRRALQTVTSA